jgi:hypothetical protein
VGPAEEVAPAAPAQVQRQDLVLDHRPGESSGVPSDAEHPAGQDLRDAPGAAATDAFGFFRDKQVGRPLPAGYAYAARKPQEGADSGPRARPARRPTQEDLSSYKRWAMRRYNVDVKPPAPEEVYVVDSVVMVNCPRRTGPHKFDAGHVCLEWTFAPRPPPERPDAPWRF